MLINYQKDVDNTLMVNGNIPDKREFATQVRLSLKKERESFGKYFRGFTEGSVHIGNSTFNQSGLSINELLREKFWIFYKNVKDLQIIDFKTNPGMVAQGILLYQLAIQITKQLWYESSKVDIPENISSYSINIFGSGILRDKKLENGLQQLWGDVLNRTYDGSHGNTIIENSFIDLSGVPKPFEYFDFKDANTGKQVSSSLIDKLSLIQNIFEISKNSIMKLGEVYKKTDDMMALVRITDPMNTYMYSVLGIKENIDRAIY